MSLETVKRIASRLLGVGVSRVRIADEKKAREALTADDVRGLVKQGFVFKTPAGVPGRGKARLRGKRRRAGRGRGPGSKRGTSSAGFSAKKLSMRRVRGLRRLLRRIKPLLKPGAYSRLYGMVKGGGLRDKRQLKEFVKNNALMAKK